VEREKLHNCIFGAMLPSALDGLKVKRNRFLFGFHGASRVQFEAVRGFAFESGFAFT
jgi:hypothetical protein